MKVTILILCLLVVGLTGFIVYDKVLSKNNIEDNNNLKDNETENNQTNNSNDNNNVVYTEKDFIRQTEITLIEEPKCNGYDKASSLKASIDTNGNVGISKNYGASMVSPGNAKYLYSVGKLACDSVTLYYITNNNELYSLDNPRSDIEQVATKVTNSDVVEFLGIEVNGNKNYLKVLLKDNTVEYINYLTTSQ